MEVVEGCCSVEHSFCPLMHIVRPRNLLMTTVQSLNPNTWSPLLVNGSSSRAHAPRIGEAVRTRTVREGTPESPGTKPFDVPIATLESLQSHQCDVTIATPEFFLDVRFSRSSPP